MKFVQKICKKKTDETHRQLVNPDPKYLSAQQLNEAETYLIKDAQKDLHNRIKKGELMTLSPFTDSEGVIRVGGIADKATVSYESKHPALLPYGSWISLLITRQSHTFGHNGVATTAAKVLQNFWIIREDMILQSLLNINVCFVKKYNPKSKLWPTYPNYDWPHTPPPFHVM